MKYLAMRPWLLLVPGLVSVLGCQKNSVSGPASTGAVGNSTGGSATAGGSKATRSMGGRTSIQQGSMIEPGNPGTSDVQLVVRSDRDLHPISPLIYGVNGDARACQNANLRPGLCRLGGNRWTAYNWENNASNAGVDYCSQNDGYVDASSSPAKPVVDAIAAAASNGAATLVTVPILDYVAADKNGGSAPPACSGDVRKSGANYLTTRFVANHPTKGSALSLIPDPNDNAVYQDEFVSFIKSKAGAARVLFSLDNEPDLWSDTHPAIQPTALTYAKLLERNIASAKAVRSAWPEAEITGPTSYGFNGYVNLQKAPDANANGDFLDYYLAKMKLAGEAHGARLVDYLDLHWYSEAKGGGNSVIGSNTSAPVVEARVQAPRSLWDATYKEASWIADYTGAPIRLIGWLNDKITKNYPGTKLAFTEWNYGGGQHISGGIAAADVLGIFGKEGVQLATEWRMQQDETFIEGAFRVYRNYDGQGASFGDTSISADSSDVSKVSVYASLDAAAPGKIVIVAINRSSSAQNAGLTVASSVQATRADVYALSGRNPIPVAGAPLAPVATNAFLVALPAYSVSVIVPKP